MNNDGNGINIPIEDQPIMMDDVEETPEVEPTEEAEAESEEETEEAEDTTEAADEESEEETEEVIELKDLTVKFLGEEKKLSDFTNDEITEFVQKGQNHDRLLEKIDKLESDPRFEVYDKFLEFAEGYGFDSEDKVDAALKTLETAMIQKRATDEGITEAQARKDLELSRKEKNLERQKKTITESKEKQSAEEKKFDKLLSKRPDLDINSIPKSVVEQVEKGVEPYEAMLEFELQEARTKSKVNDKKQKNKSKSVVKSVKGESDGKKDPFEIGFDSVT